MPTFEHQDEVRDSETDVAGVVNHANFLDYMANARHKHLRALGLDFQALLARGLMLVATKIDIRFRQPLFAGDQYCVTSQLIQPKGKQFGFEQQVLRLPDRSLVAKAVVQAACVDCQSNTPSLPEDMLRLLTQDLASEAVCDQLAE